MKTLIFTILILLPAVLKSQIIENSIGPAPYNNLLTPQIVNGNDAIIGSRTFTQISSSPTFQFGKAFMESCTITNIGTPFTITFPGGLVYRNGVVYTWNQSSPFQLWSIDTVTGVHTLVFNMTGVPQTNYTGMCWDGTTMYGVSTSITQSQIFTVNMTSGVCTPLGTASATCAGAISLMGRPGAQYSLFSTDIVADNLYKWNKTTGAVTLVGPLGQNINFGQDGTVDPNDNTFYTMCYTTGPELRKVDTTTGTLGAVLCTYTAQATGLAIVPASAGPCAVPELIYYKFENNPSPTTTPNFASAPVGSNPVTISAGHTLSNAGMYDSCLLGSSATTGVINTGWATNLGNGSWTIGMYLKNLPNQSALGTAPCYLFGDLSAGSFRCFWAGAGSGAADTAILLRKTGMTDMRLVLPNPYQTSYYVHFVYNSGTSTLSAYRNGVFVTSVTWTAPAITGTGFQVAGYNNTASPLFTGARMDEFRVYNRALDQTEITATWNKAELPGCLVGVEPVNNQIPSTYSLSQNYPNPFNPTTNIKFSLPATGNVKLVVFDMLGREVATLVNEVRTAGNYVVDFDASALASGVYFYRLESANFTQTKKMLLVK